MINGKIKSTYERYWQERIKESMGGDKNEEIPSEIYDTASSVLKSGNKVLDVGCENGYFAFHISDKFNEIYGAEFAEAAAHVAQKQNVFTAVMDLNVSLSYKDNTFDVVTCLDVIEHLLDPVSLLVEIYRVLRPKGQLVLTTPNIRNFRNLYTLIFKGTFPHTSACTFVWGGGHLHYFTTKDINNLLNKADFKRIGFLINQGQFRRSKKRKLMHFLIGEKTFGEWFCGSITVEAWKR